MAGPLKILHLEDDPRDRELVRETLKAEGVRCEVVCVETREAFIEALDRVVPDLILADYMLPSFDGLSALEIAKERAPDVPFIIVSGTMGEDPAIETLKSGATDYVLKQKLLRLVPAVKRAIEEAGNKKLLAENVRALRESESKYRVLVANADEAIFIAQDETVKFPNPKALEMTGYSTADLAAVPFAGLIHPEDRGTVLERYIARLRGGVPPETHPFRIMRKSGEEIWVLLTANLIDWEGRPGVLCLLRDITKERNLEAQFRQSQKLEAVGRLAGGIAHDFNNLLTVTLGYCDLALARIGAKDPLRRDLEEIRKASDRCATLTRQILAFSRKQILVPKVINLGDVVADMDKMLRRLIGEDLDLVAVGGKDLWNVKADPGQVEQVIVNLVVNSRDAMPGGGKLTIEASNVVLDKTYTSGHQYVSPGSYVLLAVSDTGSGMDEGTVARIFEPFFTTKEKGTGLGLSTVYGIVKQSGGHINVYSEPGIGTTFKMYFPAVEEKVTESSGPGTLPSEELRGDETILVVEDEEPVRQMVREILVLYGYTVLEARSGGEAVDLCSRHQGPVHLMLTDVVMPGMNGVELSKRLAPAQPEMQVLFMSGYTAEAITHQGFLEPGIAFIHKPFTMDSLARKMREVLDSGTATN